MSWGIIQSAFHALTIIPLGVLFFLMLSRRRKTLVEWIYLALLCAALLWIAADYTSSQLTLSGDSIPLLSIVAEIGLLGMCLSIYGFCEEYQGVLWPSSRHWRIALTASGSIFVIPLYFSERWLTNFRVENGTPTADAGIHYLLSGAWSVALLVGGYTILWIKARRTTGVISTRLRFLFWGSVIPAGAAVVTNYLLPMFGVFFYTFISTDIGILYWCGMVYALLTRPSVDLKKVFIEWILRIFGGVVLFSIAFLILSVISNRVPAIFFYAVIVTLSFFVGLILSAVMPGLFSTERRQRLEALIRDISLLNGASREFAARQAAIRLKDAFESQSAMLLYKSGREIEHTVIGRKLTIALRPEVRLFLLRLFSIKKLPDDMAADLSPRLSGSDRIQRSLGEFLDSVRNMDFDICVPLQKGAGWSGFILLQSKKGAKSFSRGDRNTLETVGRCLGLLFDQETEKHASSKWKSISESKEIRKIVLGEKTVLFRSEKMHELLESLETMASVSFPVLITGETGTGKEMAARLMHELGPRKSEPFIAINCAAIPENLWEDEIFGHARGAFTDARNDREGRVLQAGAGILFFDEIGEMPLHIQPKMLRLLQDRTFTPLGSSRLLKAECRFIFATNRELLEDDSRKSFRSDLLYRINVLRLNLPPLRERKTDIPLLLAYYLEKYSTEFGVPEKQLDEKAVQRLLAYRWPGNVRELENVVIGLLAASRKTMISEDEIDRLLSGGPTGEDAVFPLRLEEHLEKIADHLIRKALQESNGNKSQAARLLGLTRGQLLYRIKEVQDKAANM